MYYDAPGSRRQSVTSRVCDGLSESSPAVSDREVSASSLEGGSPQQLIGPFATYPAFLSSTLVHSNGSVDSLTNTTSANCSSRSPQELLQDLPDSDSTQDAQSSAPGFRQTPSSDLSYAHECELCHVCFEDIEQLMDHLMSNHSDGSSYFCGRPGCKMFKSRKDFKRHLTSTSTHSRSHFRCRCGHSFPRRENFRNHFKERCKAVGPTYPYACSCGHLERNKNLPESRAQFEAHFEQCGKGKPGRRKKT